MDKNKIKKIIIAIVVVIFLIGIAVLAFFLIRGKNPIKSIIDNFEKNNGINDNYNGIYVYKEVMNGTKVVYTGCSVTEIAHYVLIVNDTYYSFKSSCMGTYPIEEGKTENLEIKENAAKNNYVLNYQEHEYVKDPTIKEINTNNDIANRLKKIDLSNYDLILRETEFEGNYYRITANINNLSSNLVFGFDHLENGTFDISIFKGGRSDSSLLYKYNISNYDNLPVFYTFGKTLVVVEKNKVDGKLSYNFKAMSNDGVIYELDKKYPFIVDDVSLGADKNVFVNYDPAKRDFVLLMGNNDKMCVENSTSDNISYYEFRIKYDYESSNFKMPEFVKYGRENEGCSYVNKIMGG